MTGAKTRLAAADILMRVTENRRTLDEALVLTPLYTELIGADRGFARAMATAALRQLGRINLTLKPFLQRPLETASAPARALLQVGAAQIWIMGTPAHAAVGETVAAAKLWPSARKASGFINAVLRKAVAHKAAFDTSPALAVWPDWLQQTLTDSLGPAQAEALARLQMREPDLHLTIKNNAIEDVAAAFTTADLAVNRLTVGTLAVPTGAVDTYPLYADGQWWVQDAAAALPAKLLGGQPGETLIDLCAAPGGKTMQLAASGANVIALDRSEKRLKRVTENLKRTCLGANVHTIAADGTGWRPDAPVDGVLVDAPCSALGTLRRHPEGPWIKQANDIARYPKIQTQLLKAALAQTKPGGRVVYCVCSPLSLEGQDVVEAVLADGLCRRAPISAGELDGFTHTLTDAGDVLTLPGGTFDHDAFFMGRLIKQ